MGRSRSAKSSEIPVTIEVKESSNKPPVFRQGPGAEISLSEGSEDFGNIIATYTADSQIPGDPQVYFELVNGRTEQTNKEATFRAVVNRDNQNHRDGGGGGNYRGGGGNYRGGRGNYHNNQNRFDGQRKFGNNKFGGGDRDGGNRQYDNQRRVNWKNEGRE